MIPTARSLDIGSLLAAYRSRELRPGILMEELIGRLHRQTERHAWIARFDDDQLRAAARALDERDPASLPLYGIPFAIKDNIDLAGLPTTAACPAFSYQPDGSAHVVERLIAAGALPIGKTNLDQFATGLVGTRSPYGACRNAFDPAYISGGSSSGSAVVVASGLASFALGSDTAGSGRVPAAFNNLLGYKPTLGLLSPRGMLPACRSLDTVSVFALTADDAARVASVAAGGGAAAAFSRSPPGGGQATEIASAGARWGVPRAAQREFFGDAAYAAAFARTLATLAGRGVQLVEIDLQPFLEVARLLYGGPWVAERWLAVEPLLQRQPDALWPVTRAIVEQAAGYSAADAFRAQYRLAELRLACQEAWQQVDGLITPTACSHYLVAEVEAEPMSLNARLGHYTNFVNLLDLAAVALPAGFTADELPFGITLLGPAWSDAALLAVAARWQPWLNRLAGATGLPLPASEETRTAQLLAALPGAGPARIEIAVCGAHLEGLPLNWQLTQRGGRLEARTRTAPCYRFYALPGGPPLRPGLMRVADGGAAIEVEVWSLPAGRCGDFVAGIPAPLGIGKLELADGRQVPGFICEAHALEGATEITAWGGWRAWLAGRSQPPRSAGGDCTGALL